jgi:hypothetical protein
MQFLLLVYADEELVRKLPASEFDAQMRHCLERADELQSCGTLLSFHQLEPAASAQSVRARNGRTTILDGPFAETKEILAGFNLVEADSMEEAVNLAQTFPWIRYGTIEVRPVRNLAAVRASVTR